MPVTYLIVFTIVPEQRARFESMLGELIDTMAAEPMFHDATLHRDPASAVRYMLTETWEDHDDVLAVQLGRAYRQPWHEALPELLAKEREITRWEPMHAKRRAG